jgi:predicted phosphoadenosine phosphosulfate sulfurtransferase
MTDKQVNKLLTNATFVYAKSMPQFPHYYTLRNTWDCQKEFDDVVNFIRNNGITEKRYSYCWKEGEDWIHPKNPISKKENIYGTERFHELFEAIFRVEFPNQKACYLAGVRTEEAPKRMVALTSGATYKWITWGSILNKKNQHYTFYPIYDWSYTDVWKYIYSNNIIYNKVYDEMYRHGVRHQEMRISNLHHETAIQTLIMVQEIGPDTWNKLEKRIDGANTVKHLQRKSFTCPDKLPFMFYDWKEYALYLLENIIQEDEYKNLMLNKIKSTESLYSDPKISIDYWRVIITTILSSDWDLTKFTNWTLSGSVDTHRRMKKNPDNTNEKSYLWIPKMCESTKYISQEEKNKIHEYFRNKSSVKADS